MKLFISPSLDELKLGSIPTDEIIFDTYKPKNMSNCMNRIFVVLIAILASIRCFAFELTVSNIRFDLHPSYGIVVVIALPGNKKYEGNVVIPKTIEYNGYKYKVTEIYDNAFAQCPELTSVTLPEGITTIGDGAFACCPNLKEINLPSTLERIGDACFAGCVKLQSITLPEKLTEIGDMTFSDCTSLEKVTIPGNVKFIFRNAFRDCFNLREVDIESGVQFIASYAFGGCSNLKKVNIQSNVVHISKKAFMYSTNIKTMTIPNDTINTNSVRTVKKSLSSKDYSSKEQQKISTSYSMEGDMISSEMSKSRYALDQDDLDDVNAFNVLKRKTRTYAVTPGFKGSFKLGRGSFPKGESKTEKNMTFDLNIGYQFTRVLYVGVGLDYLGTLKDNFFNNSELFANVRFTIPKRLSPYFEIRGGYRSFYMQTPYWAPELGLRYGFTKRLGIMLGVSYENICLKNDDKKYEPGGDLVHGKSWKRGVMFKLGVDF